MFKRGLKGLVIILILTFFFGPIKSGSIINVFSSDKELDFLNEEIQSKKKEIEDIQKQRDQFSSKIENLQKQQASLKNQLDLLENRLARAELEIRNTENEISKVNLEIRKTGFEIEEKQNQIDQKKKQIAEIINLIYKENKADILEILLLNESFSDFINKLKYLQDINEEMDRNVRDLEHQEKELELEKENLIEKNKELADLKQELEKQKQDLEAEQESRKFLLEETGSSEDTYQQLLRQANQEREQVSQEIASLENTIRARLEAQSEDELKYDNKGLVWPVPSRYITVIYYDPTYPFRHLFEHAAIDIRAAQGTPIKAAASGYVAQIRFDPGSSRYAYIMIIHGDGLATVYGHISKPLVAEDSYVVQGQNIALSGGMPGTAGAGHLTTGPHLHFEVRLNGIPVNPMNYLP